MPHDRRPPLSPVSDGERTVHVYRQRDDQELRATLSTYRGERYVSLRVFWRPSEGAWIATRKGITVRAEQLDQLELAIGALRRAVDAEPHT